MTDEPTLPRLPAVTWDAQTQSFTGSNKRARQDSAAALFSNSSDPAVFSSDDDPAIDNYTNGRRKKRYVGTWFAPHPAPSTLGHEDGEPMAATRNKRMRKLERQPDSGVWLNSDDAELDEDYESHELPLPRASRLPGPSQRQPRQFHRVSSLQVPKAEKIARQKIQQCLEDGVENVDLTAMNLETLSNATIAPLAEFSCIPLVAEDVAFEQKVPSLKLYLASNSLRELPGMIFNLENLTVLSLRGNGLKELPQSIASLRNLESLNLSLNALAYLPIEILGLRNKLRELLLYPNPFFQPIGFEFTAIDSGHLEQILIMARNSDPTAGEFARREVLELFSTIQYSNTPGSVLSPFRFSQDTSTSRKLQVDDILNSSSFSVPKSPEWNTDAPLPTKVPSLMELALRVCYNSPQLAELPSMLPRDTAPHLVSSLQRALSQRETGGLKCSVCSVSMVSPRTARLSWLMAVQYPSADSSAHSWGFSPREGMVPFMRRGCSWQCASSRGDTSYTDVSEHDQLKSLGILTF